MTTTFFRASITYVQVTAVYPRLWKTNDRHLLCKASETRGSVRLLAFVIYAYENGVCNDVRLIRFVLQDRLRNSCQNVQLVPPQTQGLEADAEGQYKH